MPINVQCKRAIVDPTTEQRRPCGHAFKVADSLAGKVIRCPQCKQGIQVDDPTKSPAKKSKRPAAPVESMAPLATQQGIMDQETTKASGQYQKVRVCNQCGKPVASNVCKSCGHRNNKFTNQSIEKIKPKLCGMQLWFSQTIQQALPIKVMVLVMHLAMLVIVLLVGGSTIIGMTTQNVSVTAGLVILLMVAFGLIVYLAFTFKSYQFLIQPGAELAWFQKPFWSFILTLARSKNWRDYDAKLSNRVVVKADNPQTSDADVLDLPQIRQAQVLDLENTLVTDAGLQSLHILKNLRCLVLRNTQVTPAEVYRFQQAFPKVWIWY